MAAQPLAVQVGVVPACRALGVSRATFYRRRRSTPGHRQPRPTPARALCEAEREQVLDVLAGPRFVDRAPAEVVATLLDEGHYLCSERTMYRILAADRPVRERRNQRKHPRYAKPELVAAAPNHTEHRHGGIAMLTRTTSIIIEPRACWNTAGGPFKPPGPGIPNASFEASQNQTPFPKRSGSIHPRHPQQERLLSKSQSAVSQSR